MALYRVVDARFPFLWSAAVGPHQPAARWHDAGEGPVQYLADTPVGAWAELLRHEEIREPEDLAGVVAVLWAVESPAEAAETEADPIALPDLPTAVLVGGRATYEACRAEARRLRARGIRRLVAPSAALRSGEAAGWALDGGVQVRSSPRDGRVHVVFGELAGAIGWCAAEGGVSREVLAAVRHFDAADAIAHGSLPSKPEAPSP
ncbi:MAG: RES domain-containing protein [Pseudomonadota bacterium]